jgi:hypothetical protein
VSNAVQVAITIRNVLRAAGHLQRLQVTILGTGVALNVQPVRHFTCTRLLQGVADEVLRITTSAHNMPANI